MSVAEMDALLLKAMDDDFDGPTRPCGVSARPREAAAPPQLDAPLHLDEAAQLDRMLRAAMDAQWDGDEAGARDVAMLGRPTSSVLAEALQPSDRAMGFLELPHGAAATLFGASIMPSSSGALGEYELPDLGD